MRLRKIADIHLHWLYQKPQVITEGSEEIKGTGSLENVEPLIRVLDPAVVRIKGRSFGFGNKRTVVNMRDQLIEIFQDSSM